MNDQNLCQQYFTLVKKFSDQRLAMQQTIRLKGNCCLDLKKLIGQGYSSNVFMGVKKSNDCQQQQVAIKIMSNYSQEDGDMKKYILDEIKILKQLKGRQNIVQLIEVVQKQNNTYVVTQFCQRGTLKKQLQNKCRFSQKRAMKYFRQMVKGYRSLHQNQIIHRDLKPDNILLKDKENLKIADFGFAIHYNEAFQETMLVGSQLYMPLEALKKNIYTEKNDIWALGIILFQMLTGDRPFRGKTTKQLINQISFTPVKRIIPKSISEQTSQLLQFLLEKDHRQRISFEKLYELVFLQKIEHQTIKKSGTIKAKSQQYNDQINQKSLKNIKSFNILPKRLKQEQSVLNQQEKCNIRSTVLIAKGQTIQTKVSQNQDQDKKISDISISQIHFCRFTYKILSRILKLPQKNRITKQCIEVMTLFIFSSLQSIANFEFLSAQKAKLFQQSKYQKKIQKIVADYQQRYQKQLKKCETKPIRQVLKFQINIVSEQVKKMYHSIEFLTDFSNCSQIFIILDLMISFLQLSRLLLKAGVENFDKNSRIAVIVDGKITSDVSLGHLEGIKVKLQSLKLI